LNSISMDVLEITKATECLQSFNPDNTLENFDKIEIWNHKKLGYWVVRSEKWENIDIDALIELGKKGKKPKVNNGKQSKSSSLMPVTPETLDCLDVLTEMVFNDSIENTYCFNFVKTETGIDVKRWPIKVIDSANYLTILEQVLWVVE